MKSGPTQSSVYVCLRGLSSHLSAFHFLQLAAGPRTSDERVLSVGHSSLLARGPPVALHSACSRENVRPLALQVVLGYKDDTPT